MLKDHKTAIDRWNAGEIQMLLTHSASVEHGLNLQHGTNIMVWFGLTYDRSCSRKSIIDSINRERTV